MYIRIEDLLDELCAINFWDRDYILRDEHDQIERAAQEVRQDRLQEICGELAVFLRLAQKSGNAAATVVQ